MHIPWAWGEPYILSFEHHVMDMHCIRDVFVVDQCQQNFLQAPSASMEIMVPVNRALFPDPSSCPVFGGSTDPLPPSYSETPTSPARTDCGILGASATFCALKGVLS